MSSDRQIAANRANAKRSTGPRTAEGKACSAANATRHGLTRSPDGESVLRWYRIILDDPDAVPYPLEFDSYRRAARDLAEAEAQLDRVRRAEAQHLADPEGAPSEAEDELIADRKMIRSALEDAAWERQFADAAKDGPFKRLIPTRREHGTWMRQGERLLLRNRAAEERARKKRLKARARLGRTLARYRASAEARRRKALRRWIDELTKRTQSRA